MNIFAMEQEICSYILLCTFMCISEFSPAMRWLEPEIAARKQVDGGFTSFSLTWTVIALCCEH